MMNIENLKTKAEADISEYITRILYTSPSTRHSTSCSRP
ncbi:GnsA/GnsB family addiction module toxin [Escherichia coli]